MTAATANPGPIHQVWCGENLDVLHHLAGTHTGLVDLVYIDPPYNTGNTSWIYGDNRRESWTQFMGERLTAARTLMSDAGLIAVAIGDNEIHRLRVLMDDIFGPTNFVATIIWQGQGNTASHTTAGGVDYMVVYRRHPAHKPVWREPKPGVAEALGVAANFWYQTFNDPSEASRLMRQWWNGPGKHHPRGLRDYTRINADGRLYRPVAMAAPDRPGLRSHRPLPHPGTGALCKTPSMGWRLTDESMDQLLADDKVEFGPDETVIPTRRYFMDEQTWQAPPQVFYKPRRSGHLDNLLGGRRFPYPKDHTVLMRWFRMWSSPDAVVLDFFAGSGTTLEAVMRLNAEDGGRRQCLLATNNEVSIPDQERLTLAGHRPGDPEWEACGVHDFVTRPRIEAVITGHRPDGTVHGEPVPGQVQFICVKDTVLESACQ